LNGRPPEKGRTFFSWHSLFPFFLHSFLPAPLTIFQFPSSSTSVYYPHALRLSRLLFGRCWLVVRFSPLSSSSFHVSPSGTRSPERSMYRGRIRCQPTHVRSGRQPSISLLPSHPLRIYFFFPIRTRDFTARNPLKEYLKTLEPTALCVMACHCLDPPRH